MKSLARNLAIILGAALLIPIAPFAGAQDAAKKSAAPKPADSPSKVLLDSWNDIGRKLIAMAEDFPEDKYDFKPNPRSGRLLSNCCTRPEVTTSSSIRPRPEAAQRRPQARRLQDQSRRGRIREEVIRRGRGADREQGRQGAQR